MTTLIDNPVKQTKVIMLNGRYFSRFGKKGQVQTAWSLVGAKTFNESCDLNPVLKKLDEKRKKYTVEQIELFERVDCYPPKELFKLRYRLERMMKKSACYQNMEHLFAFESKANANLVERVFLTTMQLQVAERNNSKTVNEALDWYFLIDGPTSPENAWEGHLIGRSFLNLDVRLDMYKARKHNLEFCDDVPF